MSNLRSLISAVAMGAALVGVPVVAFAAEEPTGPFGGNIAGTVGFVTDYKYRGISQSGNDPAVQGSLEYSIPVAGEAAVAYASLWGSSINFGGNLETDWTAGVRGVVNGFGYDVNVLYYYYPGSNSGANLDFVEVGGKLSYDFGFVVPYVGFRYSPDFQGNAAGNTGHAEFYTAGATVPLSYGMLTDYSVVLMGEVSRQKIQDNARWGTPDYTTWTVGISATAFTLNWALQYIDTDMNKAECFGGSNVCEGRAVFSVSKTF